MDKKRRRLSYGISLKNSGSNDLALAENDDAKEKQERRKSRIMMTSGRKSLAGSFGEEDNLFSQNIDSIPPKNPLSNNQLSELYSICLRLCSENKINTKNTWSLDLIDYIDDVLDVQKKSDNEELDGPGTNFQAASATLDASIKIYSCRVDSVYSEAYKVVGGLSSEDNQENQENIEPSVYKSVENDEDDEEVKEKKKRVKRNRATNTLATNDSEITVKKFDLEFSVDPLFRKTSAAFDEGGAKGLLFNHLTIHKCCEIVFDSSEMNNEEDSFEISVEPIDISELKNSLYTNQPNLSKLEICPAYINWTSHETSEIDLDDLDINLDKQNEDNKSDDEDSINGYDFENDIAHGGDMNVVDLPIPMEIDDIDDVNVILDDTEGKDYSYFNFNKLSGLNGAQHWKFNIEKPKKKAKSEKKVKYDEDGNIVESKRKTAKKNTKIDFFGKEPEGFEKLFETAGRSSTTLTKAALTKQEKQSVSLLLPEEEYDKENFTKLFLHRSINPNNKGKEFNDEYGNEEMTHDVSTYMDDEVTGMDDFDIDMDGIIAKPRHQAEVLTVNYAKVDKKVDVKALKQNIWTELLKTNETDDSSQMERSFQGVLDVLPETIPSHVINEISVPYCFVCLLHLANEKSLSLYQDSFDEIKIKQTVNNTD